MIINIWNYWIVQYVIALKVWAILLSFDIIKNRKVSTGYLSFINFSSHLISIEIIIDE